MLKTFGWVPNELSYQEVKLSMQHDQIEQYGEVVRAFIGKYNDKVRAMMLPPQLRMPATYELKDMLVLSRFVNHSSPRAVGKMMRSMDDDLLKQLLLNIVNCFFDPKVCQLEQRSQTPSHFEHDPQAQE